MNEKLLIKFLDFLNKEGLLSRPFSYGETIEKFYSLNKTSANIEPPKKYKGFAIGEKEKNTFGE